MNNSTNGSYPTIQDYHYIFVTQFELGKRQNKELDELQQEIYNYLKTLQLPLMDVRAGSCGASSYGTNPSQYGYERTILYMNIGIVSYAPMIKEEVEKFCQHFEPCAWKGQDIYAVKDCRLRLYLLEHLKDHTSPCGCSLHETLDIPLSGLYYGEYLKPSPNYNMHQASWNYKSYRFLHSVAMKTDEKIRDARIVDRSGNSIWSLGFGFL